MTQMARDPTNESSSAPGTSERVLRQLEQLLQESLRPKRESRLLEKIFHSPLSVALLGSGLISIITLVWQARAAESARTVAAEQLLYDSRIKFVLDFGTQFPRVLSLNHLYMAQRLRLESWRAGKPPTGSVPVDAKAVDATIATLTTESRDTYKELLLLPPSDALCTEIALFFVGRDAEDLSAQLRAKVELMKGVTVGSGTFEEARSQLATLAGEADLLYQSLMAAMGKEVRAMTQKGEHK